MIPNPNDATPAAAAETAAGEAIDETEPVIDLGDEPSNALQRGADVIKANWKHAPLGPGVYRMLGADGEVLYVGKAKSVR